MTWRKTAHRLVNEAVAYAADGITRVCPWCWCELDLKEPSNSTHDDDCAIQDFWATLDSERDNGKDRSAQETGPS